MSEEKELIFDNELIEALVIDYKNSEDEEEKHNIFCDIALSCIPMIKYVSNRNDQSWLKQINEPDVNAIISEITLKLPKILDGFNIEKAKLENKTFYSYFTKTVENRFRHWNRGINVRKKYSTEWPTDENGEQIDIPDTKTVRRNSLETEEEKYREFEKARFGLPLEIGNTLPQPYKNIVRFVAKRFLDRVDNREQLFISELSHEVSQLSIASDLTPVEIDNLVRLSMACIRSGLYSLREDMTEEECQDYIANLLENGDPKIWSLLAIFDAKKTVKLLHCLAGIMPSVPPINRFIKRKKLE